MTPQQGAQACPGSHGPATVRGPPRASRAGTALGRHVGLDKRGLLMEATPSEGKRSEILWGPSRYISSVVVLYLFCWINPLSR